jgi:Anthrax toxin LF subunit
MSISSFGPPVHQAPRLDELPSPVQKPGGASLESLDNLKQSRGESDLRQVIQDVQDRTGIVASHLEPLLNVAKEHNCIIGMRPVESVATGLIEDGHPTKDFHIKGKSANWGPQAGMICVDQAFSKLEGKGLESITKFSGQTSECIKDGYAVAVPLVISRERMAILLSLDLITDMCHPDAEGLIKFSATGHTSGETYSFEATPEPGGEDLYQISQQGQPLQVLAKEVGGKPLTADYDLHLIGPHISDLGSQDNLPVPDVAHKVFKERIDGYISGGKSFSELAPELHAAYADPGYFYAKEDEDIGNATSRITAMIPVINKALVGEGEKVVHHNADSGSPAADNGANYPATFFLPVKLGEFKEICVINNHNEMRELIQEAKNSGYHIPLNPLWEQEVTSVRREDFANAQTFLSENAHMFRFKI